jgi:hypothetical protein
VHKLNGLSPGPLLGQGVLVENRFSFEYVYDGRLIISALDLLVLVLAVLITWPQSTMRPGNFPSGFSEADKQQIVSAARQDANRQALTALAHFQFRSAWAWIVNARKQSVRCIGNQPDGKIHVVFGIDESNATDGYAIWARYLMTNQSALGHHATILTPLRGCIRLLLRASSDKSNRR